jgi:hypothetical protein
MLSFAAKCWLDAAISASSGYKMRRRFSHRALKIASQSTKYNWNNRVAIEVAVNLITRGNCNRQIQHWLLVTFMTFNPQLVSLYLPLSRPQPQR